MSIFQRREGDASASSSPSPSTPRTGGDFDYRILAPCYGSAGSMSVATVYRCLDILANSVASLPLHYMRRREDGVFVTAERDRLHYLLTVRPNPECNAFDFWARAVRTMLMRGDAYIIPQWNALNPYEVDYLFLCNPGTVSHDTVNNRYLVMDTLQGISGDFGEDEIIHLMNLTLDGKTGLSVLTFAAQTVRIASTGDAETLNRFENGGSVRGIVSNDTSVRGFGEYQDKELQKTASDMDRRFSSGDRIVSIPGQAKFTPLSLSSVDLEFLNTRKFSVREICRFFGVPPTFVFDDSSNNYKSAEMANVSFLSQTLNPILSKIELELQCKLLSQTQSAKARFEFDRRKIYSTDLASKAEYQTKTIGAGIYTINDWRRFENMPPVEGGDTPLVSANLKTINQLVSSAAAEEPAQPKPNENEPNEE